MADGTSPLSAIQAPQRQLPPVRRRLKARGAGELGQANRKIAALLIVAPTVGELPTVIFLQTLNHEMLSRDFLCISCVLIFIY